MYNHKAAPFPPLCRLHCTTTCWSPFPDPCWPSCWPPFLPSCQLSCPSYPFSLLPLRDVAKKKQWENVGFPPPVWEQFMAYFSFQDLRNIFGLHKNVHFLGGIMV